MVMVKQDKGNRKAIFAGWRMTPRPVLVAATAVDCLCRVKYNFNQVVQTAESVKPVLLYAGVLCLADGLIHTKLSQEDG